ncbi:MAG: alcohol dehydrogenase catalytic domain-containing protein, partial [Thermoanaerobaculia bacterium]
MKSKPKKSRSSARFPLMASRLPARMTAVVKTKAEAGPSATEVRAVPVPSPGQAEVLIKVIATAVCGSDKHIYQWDASMASMFQPPRIYG